MLEGSLKPERPPDGSLCCQEARSREGLCPLGERYPVPGEMPCFLPGRTPPWHTLRGGRSLGRGRTGRTHRLRPSTPRPGAAQSRRVSSFEQETRTPHSTPRGAGPFSDPGETERRAGEGWLRRAGTHPSQWGRRAQSTTILCPLPTQPAR